MNPTTDNQYDMESAIQATEQTPVSSGNIDIAAVGRKIKQIYPTGIASDGRSYLEIPDEEIGSKYILKNGDKGLTAIGMDKPATDTKQEATLRKEFNSLQEIKDYKNARDSWQRAKDVPQDGSGDLTLLYSYIKALDPNSVVREGEIDISKATASVPENIVTAYKRVKEGKLLSDQQRIEYQGEVGRIYNYKAKIAQETQAHYTGLATDMGAQPEKVVGGLDVKLAEVPEAPVKEGSGGSIVGSALNAVSSLIPSSFKHAPQNMLGTATKITGEQGQRQAEREAKGITTKGNLGESAKVALENTVSAVPDAVKTALPIAADAALLASGGSLVKAGASKLPIVGNIIKNNATKGPFGIAKNIVGNKRAAAAKALEDAGVSIDETRIAEDLMEYASKKAPLSMKKSAENYALMAIDRFKNKTAPITNTLDNLTQANEAAFLQSGVAGRASAAKIEKVVGDSIRKQISERAPDVAAANKAFETIYGVEKGAKKVLDKYGPVAILGKLLGGI